MFIAFAFRIHIKERFKNLFSRTWRITNFKFLELQFLYHSQMLVELALEHTNRTQDHAGTRLALGLLGVSFDLHLYDSRHAEK